jgi:hypothetical protein
LDRGDLRDAPSRPLRDLGRLPAVLAAAAGAELMAR